MLLKRQKLILNKPVTEMSKIISPLNNKDVSSHPSHVLQNNNTASYLHYSVRSKFIISCCYIIPTCCKTKMYKTLTVLNKIYLKKVCSFITIYTFCRGTGCIPC